MGARAPSSGLGAKDKRTTMLLMVLSPFWVEIRRTQAPMLIRVLCACAGTHGSPGHVCHWVGTPSLEEGTPWATMFPGCDDLAKSLLALDMSYKQCGLEESPFLSGLLFSNVRKGVRINGHPVNRHMH